MKLKINILVSIILALIVTSFIVNKTNKNNSLQVQLKKTELKRLDGVKFNKNEIKNKLVIISYFQTWCSDCVKEQPDLLKLKEKFKDQLEILMVSDEPIDLMIKFKDKFNSDLEYYHSSVHLKPDLGIKGYPSTYLFDKKGNILMEKVEGIHWYTPEIISIIEQSLAQ